MADELVPELVPDVLEKILIGFDAKDIIRCKCVCKSWKSFISNPRFIKSHLNHNNNKICHRRIKISSGYHFVGSSNGLVCISNSDAQMLVANPMTRESIKLRKPKLPSFRQFNWGFGYDESTDDYKVILGFTKGKVGTCFQVLTLKSNTWKDIGEVKYRCYLSAGILCNGALHWVTYSPKNDKEVILSLDLSKEEFKIIPRPDDMLYQSSIGCLRNISLGIMKGCLCIYHGTRNIWVMNKYDVKHAWAMVEHDNNAYQRPALWWNWTTEPIYVPSLVSPCVNSKHKRKRKRAYSKRNVKINKRDLLVAGSSEKVSRYLR